MRQADLLSNLAREADDFQTVLAHADLGVPVDACGAWTLGDLALHVAGVHRWAMTAVSERVLREDAAPVLSGRHAILSWVADCAEGLIDALQSTSPEAVCPGLEPGPHNVAWWTRRQAHETALHRWDAELAAGQQPSMAEDLALDGVAEVVDVVVPRQVRLGRLTPHGDTVALVDTRGGRRWTIGAGEPVAVVRAAAPTLLLLLWKRLPLEAAAVEGDVSAARDVVAQALTP